MHIQATDSTSVAGAVAACFFMCLPLTIVAAEIFYRLVDCPSQAFARLVFDWIRK